MQRIHFTAADFARTRLRTTAGPQVEVELALELLRRGGAGVYRRWRTHVNAQLSRQGAAPAPGEVWKLAVAPYWSRILDHLQAECDARGRIVMAGGVDLLLGTLHSKIAWNADVLEIHDGPDRDIFLGGRGLLLSPSVFLGHRPGRFIDAAGEPGQAALVFAAPPDAEQAAALWDAPRAKGVRALSALVGQTRAAALEALRGVCTTGQLADRLGVSAACASQHTAILRKSGLITTRRARNSVLHSVTPLGVALLEGKASPEAVAGLPARLAASSTGQRSQLSGQERYSRMP